MHTAVANHECPTEVSILARVLGNEQVRLPAAVARYHLAIEFSEGDRARMHELAIGNQNGTLSSAEQEELFAFAKAGSLLSILKSRARRTLRIKSKKRTAS